MSDAAGRPRADATTRFSDRVVDYAAYRPGYPAGLFAWLAERAGLGDDADAVDVGAGTGIFSGGLLARGWRVAAVEPNAEMRAAAVTAWGDEPRFAAVDGTAEATGLVAGTADLVCAAQAAHWFDLEACAAEWRRLLRPGGHVALAWNRRDPEASAFMRAYEATIVGNISAYDGVTHRNLGEAGVRTFLGEGVEAASFPNHQDLDRAAFHGRVLSSSYAPKPGQEGCLELAAALDGLFDDHAEDGRVRLVYRCRCHLARWG